VLAESVPEYMPQINDEPNGKAFTSLRDEFFLPNWELGARQLGGWQPEEKPFTILTATNGVASSL